MATIKDIANETGLALATISKYINGGNVREKNKTAIDAAIEKLGFTINGVARGLKTGKSYTVGVIIPELNNLFVTTIITVIADILRKSGYGIIICDCRTDEAQEREAVRFLMEKMVDGIVNMPVSRNGEHLALPLASNIPVVLLDRMIPALQGRVNAVLVDNVGAASSAVEQLFNAGHRDIGIILGPQDVFTSQQRLLGYNQVLIQNMVTPDPSRILYSDYSIQGGYESMKRLIREKTVSAVFATNYEMTLGSIIAINELGASIPDRISFIGFDNMQLSQIIKPKLTIVTQPLVEIGRNAAEILLEKFSAPQTETKLVTLSTGIVAGDSVKTL